QDSRRMSACPVSLTTTVTAEARVPKGLTQARCYTCKGRPVQLDRSDCPVKPVTRHVGTSARCAEVVGVLTNTWLTVSAAVATLHLTPCYEMSAGFAKEENDMNTPGFTADASLYRTR